MADSKYVKWNAQGVEVEQPGEKEKIQEVSDQFNRFQMMNFNEHHRTKLSLDLTFQDAC